MHFCNELLPQGSRYTQSSSHAGSNDSGGQRSRCFRLTIFKSCSPMGFFARNSIRLDAKSQATANPAIETATNEHPWCAAFVGLRLRWAA